MDVFISYRRNDKPEFAQAVEGFLKANNYDAFVDVVSMSAGTFSPQLLKEIDSCKVFLVILSPGIFDRYRFYWLRKIFGMKEKTDYVLKEVSYALTKRKKIIPLVYEGFSFRKSLPDDFKILEQYQCVPVHANQPSGWRTQLLEYMRKAIDEEPAEDLRETQYKSQSSSSKVFPWGWLVVLVIMLFLAFGFFFHQKPANQNTPTSISSTEKPNESTCLVHIFAPATCTKPRTCNQCGKTEGEPLNHVWEPATLTEPKRCSRCGIYVGHPLGHVFLPETCVHPRTCRYCEITEGTPLGHDWEENTTHSAKICKRCGMIEPIPSIIKDE